MGANVGSDKSRYPIGGGGRATSGQQDKGYKGDASYHHAVGDNLVALQAKFPYNEGYFGVRGSSSDRRQMFSDDPLAQARDFYETSTYGGVETSLKNGKGVMTTMSDGTVISMRGTSKSGSPAVDISIRQSSDPAGIKEQRIHFELEEDDKR